MAGALDQLLALLTRGRPAYVPQGTPSDRAVASAAGMTAPPNIDLNMRPAVPNQGGLSTVYSMGFGDNGRETVVPGLASDGSRVLSPDEAIAQYFRTGQHLGRFGTQAQSEDYAQRLHEAQAQQYQAPGMRLLADHPAAPPSMSALDYLRHYLGGLR